MTRNATQQHITKRLISAYEVILLSKPPTRQANECLRHLIEIAQACPDEALAQQAHQIVCRWSGKIPRVDCEGENRKANARLIAAAPELLEALIQTCDLLDMAQSCVENKRDSDRIYAGCVAGRAATAKATAAI